MSFLYSFLILFLGNFNTVVQGRSFFYFLDIILPYLFKGLNILKFIIVVVKLKPGDDEGYHKKKAGGEGIGVKEGINRGYRVGRIKGNRRRTRKVVIFGIN